MTMPAELKGLLPLYEKAVQKDPYLPIIEAITNAFDSIIKADSINKTVRVSFLSKQRMFPNVSNTSQRIDEIVIEDCGTGFDDENVASFKTVATTHKKDIGCKGMGRLSWLCRFKRVVIESTFREQDAFFSREIHFSLDKEVDVREKQPIETKAAHPKTRVRLLEPLTHVYDNKILSRSFVSQIKRVFVPYLIQHKGLSIQVEAVDGHLETIDCANLKIKELPTQPIKGIDFKVYCLSSEIMLKQGIHHAYNLCGDNRVVESEKLDIYPNEKLAVDAEKPAYLYFFIMSEYLNKQVSTTRDSFNIQDKPHPLGFLEEKDILYMEDIKNFVIDTANTYAELHIEEANNQKRQLIHEVVTEYPHLKPSVETLKIGYSHTREKIIIEAFAEQAKRSEDAKNKLLKASEKPLSKVTEQEKDSLSRAIADVTHENALQLGHYMAYRGVVLNLLDKYLKLQEETGTFPLEEHLHQIICPMRESHKTLGSHEHNLWVLDERLMMLKEFYSDISMSASKKGNVKKETDILWKKPIFLAQSKYANKLSNVAIVELKRPNRKLKKTDELQEVITKYVSNLTNQSLDLQGEKVGKEDKITHAYTVLTMFPETQTQLSTFMGYTPSCDKSAYRKDYPDFNCIHYVIDWSRLIQDAKDRHAFFFRQLMN